MRRYGAILASVLLFSGCGAEEGQPEEQGISAAPVEYTAGGILLKGYLAYDEAVQGERPGVLVVHEWWGHNDYARKRAEMLAELGYSALAVDMYGDGKNTQHPEQANAFMNEVLQDLGEAEKRFGAALDLLKAHQTVDGDRIAAIGYCFGGGVVLHMARTGVDLAGVVSFHGSLGSMHTPEEGGVKSRILVLHGAADPLVPPEQVEGFKKEMDAAGADYRFIAYEGAQHAFTNPGATAIGEEFGLPLAYHEGADRKSWEAMKRFLNDVFAE